MWTKIFKYSLLMFVFLGICVETDQNICGGLYTYDHGEISTPNYPNSYPSHWECKWNIIVAKNQSILLIFEDFFTYESDFLNIYDIKNGNINLLGRYSHSKHPKHLISSQNHLYLNFLTTVPRKGFKLSYKTLDSGCGGVYSNLFDTIRSPGYPLNYEDLNCTWNIDCPANRIINLKLNDVNLENKHAYLTIEDSSNLLTNLSSQSSHISLITRSNKVALKLISDKSPNSQDFRGFSISYNCVIVGTNLTFIISAANAIIITDPNKTNDKIVFNSVFKHNIIDYNIRKNKLILFDPQLNQIIPNFFEQRITRIQINNELNLMAYDWIHEIFYWIDTQTSDLNAMDFNDGSNYEKVSISEVLAENQRDLLINIEKYVLIWSEIGVEPKLWSINSDGTEQKVLYSNSRQAFHLTIDYQTKRYYFVDITDFSLISIDFNGFHENYLMTSKKLLDSLIQMTATGNDIYLANDVIIYRVSELSDRRPEILFKSYDYDSKQNQIFDYKSVVIKRQKIFGFKIVDQKLQPNFSNKCVNSQCHGFCLPTTRSFRCINSVVNNAPVIMKSGQNHTTLPILNSVIIAFLIISVILLYLSLKQIIVKLENRIFQVLVPAVTFRKSCDSKHEYENHDYEEPVFKN